MTLDLTPFIHKRVTFRFTRQELAFDLSQSLFSSFDVDNGTRFLLKTIAKKVDLTAVHTALDVGCGVGVIGLSVQKVNPAIRLTAQDRDALAMAFTAHNAELNGLAVELPGWLGLHGLDGRTFDLILSNLPGKVGQPVLADMLTRMAMLLSENGRAAVVVVKPLADFIKKELETAGREILHWEQTKGHAVFHFRGGETAVPIDQFSPFFRDRQRFKGPHAHYALETAYGLPEFDTLGYETAVAYEVLKSAQIKGRVLVWNPGQGHLPVYLQKRFGKNIILHLAGRDLLSLFVARRNLENAAPETAVAAWHMSDLQEIDSPFDFIGIFPGDDPGAAGPEGLPAELKRLLIPGGQALIAARSTFLTRLWPHRGDLRVCQDKKRHGRRAVLLKSPG